MRFPFPEPASVSRPGQFAVSVFSDHVRGEVVAFLHRQGIEGSYFVKVEFSLLPDGIVEERSGRGAVQRETLRPLSGGEVKEDLERRVRKFARRYGVAPENIRYQTWDEAGRKLEGRFEPPPAWRDARILRGMRRQREHVIQEEKTAHARSLCKQAWEWLGSGRLRVALRQFREAGRLAGDFYLPLIGIAEVLIRENKCEEAQRQLEQARRLLEKSRGLSVKTRQKETKRIDEAFGRLDKQLEVQKISSASSANLASSVSDSPSGLCEALPIPISFSIENSLSPLLEKYEQKDFEPLDLHRLRLEAESLRFFGGFDELLAPSHASIDSYEHQIRTARIVLRRMRGRALLCDEVGLGKTIEAGLVLKEYLLRGMISKVLILAAPSLVSQWRMEMAEKFGAAFLSTEEMNACPNQKDFWKEPYIIASLALAKREPHQSLILNQDYDLVIVDEAHHVRNRRTLAWKFVNQIKKKYLLLLTATPIHNDLEELYNLITLLRPGQLGTPAQFRGDFAERGSLRKPRNTEKLRSLLRELMIRNTRASAAVKLPRRIARTIPVTFTDAELNVYQLISGLVRELALERGAASWFLLTLLQREAGSSLRAVVPTLEKLESKLSDKLRPRLEEIVGTIRSIEEASKFSALWRILAHTPEKCLIFTEFLATQAYLAESLARAGERVGLFHGSLTSQEKTDALREFQEEGRILILTPSGGEGTNLQFCRTLINYDLPWNPMKIEQRIGRIHRIGQTGDVFIYNLAARQTVEYYLLKILDEKLNLFELVVGEAETILGELTEEKDFEEILMEIWLEAANAKELEVKIDVLGNRILEEKAKYLETKRLDEALFKQDYETV